MPYTRAEKLAILGWLTAGAIIGWATAVHLWQAGRLIPEGDAPQMLAVVALCMIATTVYGARRRLELLPRLIAYPLFFAGLTWFLRPQVQGIRPSFRYERNVAALNVLCPLLIVMLIFGGIVAVVFAKPRADDRATSDNGAKTEP